jgi:hypothetical protein
MMYYGVQQEKVIIWNQTWTTQRHQIRSPKVPHQYGARISQIWAAINGQQSAFKQYYYVLKRTNSILVITLHL